MNITVGLAISYGVGAFLLSWVAKHFLDRLLLPGILDWWARQSKKMALNRAEFLLKQFETDLRHASNVQLLLFRLEDRRYRFFILPFTLSLLLLLAILARQYVPDDKATPEQIGVVVLAVVVQYIFWNVGFVNENSRNIKAFSDIKKYREQTTIRLERLLRASGLGDAEVQTWLLRLPPLPISLS